MVSKHATPPKKGRKTTARDSKQVHAYGPGATIRPVKSRRLHPCITASAEARPEHTRTGFAEKVVLHLRGHVATRPNARLFDASPRTRRDDIRDGRGT